MLTLQNWLQNVLKMYLKFSRSKNAELAVLLSAQKCIKRKHFMLTAAKQKFKIYNFAIMKFSMFRL